MSADKNPLPAHSAPKPFPIGSLVALMVPPDFNKVIATAGRKNGLTYEAQLLAWAQMGAECSRLHQSEKRP